VRALDYISVRAMSEKHESFVSRRKEYSSNSLGKIFADTLIVRKEKKNIYPLC